MGGEGGRGEGGREGEWVGGEGGRREGRRVEALECGIYIHFVNESHGSS